MRLICITWAQPQARIARYANKGHGDGGVLSRDWRSRLRQRRKLRRYLRLVRNWLRCVVQSEPPVEFVAQEPCQPQTQVMVCSRCLYWSIT